MASIVQAFFWAGVCFWAVSRRLELPGLVSDARGITLSPSLLRPTKYTLATKHHNVSFYRVTSGSTAFKPEHEINTLFSSNVEFTTVAHKDSRTCTQTYHPATKQSNVVGENLTLPYGRTQTTWR